MTVPPAAAPAGGTPRRAGSAIQRAAGVAITAAVVAIAVAWPRAGAPRRAVGSAAAAPGGASGSGAASGSGCPDLDRCELACAASAEPAPCVRFADKQRARPGARGSDRAAARDRYRAVCRATRDPLACTRLALLGGVARDPELAPDWLVPAQAPLALLVSACEGAARGELACAALELLDAGPGRATAGRARLCAAPEVRDDRVSGAAAARSASARPGAAAGAGMATGAGTAPASGEPRRCAAAVALAACRADDDPEACYLAAADGAAAGAEARARLDALCDLSVRPACHYLWMRTGARDRLLTACPDVADGSDDAVAAACVARGDEPRGAQLRARACMLGLCDAADLAPEVAERACVEGRHLGACAAHVLALRANRSRWAPVFVAHRDRLAVDVRDARVAQIDAAALSGEEAACYLGARAGCAAALARGRGDAKRTAALAGYLRRLDAPLAAE